MTNPNWHLTREPKCQFSKGPAAKYENATRQHNKAANLWSLVSWRIYNMCRLPWLCDDNRLIRGIMCWFISREALQCVLLSCLVGRRNGLCVIWLNLGGRWVILQLCVGVHSSGIYIKKCMESYYARFRWV